MVMVNVHAAKTGFSKLLHKVERGEEVTIARNGKPIAKLVAIEEKRKPVFGSLRGQFVIPDDFNDPLPEDFLITPEVPPPSKAKPKRKRRR